MSRYEGQGFAGLPDHLQPSNLPTPHTRIRWRDYIKAAITDLRGSDRSPFEQHVLDFLRIYIEPHLEQ